MGGWQDDHAEKDVEESQRGRGQDGSASRCPFEQVLLGRRPQCHGKRKAPVRFEATCGNDSPTSTPARVLQECWCSAERWLTSISATIKSEQPVKASSRSAGAVPSTGSPQSSRQCHRSCRGREASSFVAWSSRWSPFIGTLHCLRFDIC